MRVAPSSTVSSARLFRHGALHALETVLVMDVIKIMVVVVMVYVIMVMMMTMALTLLRLLIMQ